jgi:hypothetical protein
VTGAGHLPAFLRESVGPHEKPLRNFGFPFPRPRNSLLAERSFPVPARREIPPKMAGNGPFSGPRRAAMARNPSEFPAFSLLNRDSAPRDGFALDSPLRHVVCGCRDFAPAPRDPPRNSRAFAGSWERGTAKSGPETASSGRWRAAGRACLCCQVWRSRFASDSPYREYPIRGSGSTMLRRTAPGGGGDPQPPVGEWAPQSSRTTFSRSRRPRSSRIVRPSQRLPETLSSGTVSPDRRGPILGGPAHSGLTPSNGCPWPLGHRDRVGCRRSAASWGS